MSIQLSPSSLQSVPAKLPPGMKLVAMYPIKRGRFTRVAWSPDGKTIALPSRDNTIHMYDLDNRQARILGGHPGAVISVAFRGDGRALAAGTYGARDNIIIWDRDSGQHYSLSGHLGQCSTLTWPNGRTLVSGSYVEKTIRFWDVENRTTEWLTGERVSSVTHGFFAGRLVIAASSLDGEILLIDAEDGWLIRGLEGHTQDVLMVSFGHDALASCSKDGTIRIWDSNSGECLRVLRDHNYDVLSVAYSSASGGPQLLYSKSRDHTERIFSDDGVEIARLQSAAEPIGWNCSGAWHPFFPRVPLLASITDGDKTLRVLELDLEVLFGGAFPVHQPN